MGAIAEGFVAYVQPLIDQTDGSEKQLNRAMTIGQLCFNLALLPDDQQDRSLGELRSTLEMDDDEFDAFLRVVVFPMIQRHEEMFPQMHVHFPTATWQEVPSPWEYPKTAAPAEKHPVTDRYAPCPCNSGRKYKFCCGATRH
ncbi:MAG: hypothetical protein EXS05_08215 [Planctomycetaceae bacterium]|nr:hypothetical protein [Planctomycetaceae bacterium]